MKLYVGNLPYSMTDADLEQLFAAHGTVQSVQIIIDRDTGRSKGFGPGRGWHKVTDYQYQQLGDLLDGLEAALGALPAGCVAQSIEPPPAYAIFATGRRVGHASLHAARRGDPWPAVCDWMRSRG